MRLINIISNTQRRFKTVESKPGKEFLISRTIGALKSVVRGGVTGAILGASASNGDEKYVIGGAIIGAGLDVYQDLKRLLGLMSMYKNDPKGYELSKEIYQRVGLVD